MKYTRLFIVLLGLIVSENAFSQCANLTEMVTRINGLKPGTPLKVSSIRGNAREGIVEDVITAPDGRRVVSLRKSDGKVEAIYIDQLDPSSFRAPLDSLQRGTQITIKRRKGRFLAKFRQKTHGGTYLGKKEIDGKSYVQIKNDKGIEELIPVTNLDESSLVVRSSSVQVRPGSAPRAPPASSSLSSVTSYAKNPSDGTRFLREEGLIPQYSHTVGDARYTLSDIVDLGDGRVAVVAIVETGDQKVMRLFYRSNSHAEFKVMPARNKLDDLPGSHPLRGLPGYDKGDVGQFALSAPPEIQRELARRLMSKTPKKVPEEELIAATTRVNQNLDDVMTYGVRNMSGETTSTRILKFDRGKEKVPNLPEKVTINSDLDKPIFSEKVMEYTTTSRLSGQLEVYVYKSKSGLQYTMYKDSANRVWIGSVSKPSAVNSYGVRSQAVDAGDLTSPIYDYEREIRAAYKRAGNPAVLNERGNPIYYDNWNYVREIPAVKRWYLENPDIPMPPPSLH